MLHAALALGALLRFGLLVPYAHVRGVGDELTHYVFGVLATYYGSSLFGQWGPLYDTFVAGLFQLAGPDPLVVRAAQAALGTGCVALVYVLARANASRRAARIAALLFALDPTLVAFTHYLYTETVFIALLLAALTVLFRGRERRAGWQLAAGGALLGLTMLTRSVAFYFLVLWPLWELARGRRRQAWEAAVVLAVTLAVVAPWTVRNAFKYHDFMLVDGTLGRTAYFAFSENFFSWDLGYAGREAQRPVREECRMGPAPGAPRLPTPAQLEGLFTPGWYGLYGTADPGLVIWRTRRFATEDLAAVQRCELGRALAFLRDEPGTVATHVLHRFYAFWGPNSFLLRAVAIGSYEGGPLAAEHYPIVKWTVIGLHVALVASALLLFGRRRVPELALWCAAFVAYYTAIHMAAVAYSRYRLPVMPLVVILSSFWLAAPQAPEGTPRRLAIGAALVAFAGLCVHYVATRLP